MDLTTTDEDEYDRGLDRGRALTLEIVAQLANEVGQEGNVLGEYANGWRACAKEIETRIRALLSPKAIEEP